MCIRIACIWVYLARVHTPTQAHSSSSKTSTYILITVEKTWNTHTCVCMYDVARMPRKKTTHKYFARFGFDVCKMKFILAQKGLPAVITAVLAP